MLMWIIYAYGHLILSNKFLGEKIIRMKVKVIFYASLLMLCSCVKEKETAIMVKNGFERAEQQLSAQLQNIPEPTEYPRTINKQGTLKTTKKNDWTEGFYPGCLWYVYEYNKSEDWKREAIKWTEASL